METRKTAITTLVSLNPGRNKILIDFGQPPDILSKSRTNADARKVLKVRVLMQKEMTTW